LSYELTNGVIPEELLVLHSCNNKKCVNPNHLRLGTSQDNADDRIKANGHYGKTYKITAFNLSVDMISKFKKTAFELTKTERGRSVVAEAMMQYCEDNKEDFKQFFYYKPNSEGDKK
jgi:RNA binding exosome subunit